MEALRDRQYKTVEYFSRYNNFAFAYNENDKKYIYELTSNLEDNTPHIVHTIAPSDTLDYLSNKYYGRPDLFWVIADFNRIQDPFIPLWGNYEKLKVPTITKIDYK